MPKSWKLLVFIAAVAVGGCAGVVNRPPLNTNISDIILTATTRAQDEWFCSDVNGTLKGVKKPPKRRNWYDPDYPTQYTVAVAGCGRSSVYTILCPQDGVRCYAVVPGEQEPTLIEELAPGSGIWGK